MFRTSFSTRRIGFLSASAIAAALPSAVPCAQAAPLDVVTVTASPIQTSLGDTATAVTTVSRDELLRSGGKNLGEALGDLPGVAQSSFSRGSSRPIIRGLDNARIRIQENGIGSHDAAGVSEDHGVPIDPLAAQSIEIIRGAGVLRYGSEAIGGVVSIVNNRIPKSAPEQPLRVEIFGDAGQVDAGHTLSGLVDAGNARGSLHLDGFWREAEDYETPRGIQTDSYSDSKGIAAGGAARGEGGYVGVSFAAFQSQYGIPAAELPTFIDLQQTKTNLAAGYEWDGGILESIELTAGVTDYTHDEVAAATGDVGSTFNNDEWEMRFETVLAARGRFSGAFGLQYRNRDLAASGEGGELLAPNETAALGVFLFEEVTLTDRLKMQAALRYERVEADGTGLTANSLNGSLATTLAGEAGVSRRFSPVSWAVGTLFELTDSFSLGGTVQRVERAPDTVELFSKGPHEATETFEIGNPALATESALSFEAVAKQHTDRRALDLAVFYTRFNDFIYKSFSGLVCGDAFGTCGLSGDPGVEDELTQIAFAQTDAEFYGAEASWREDLVELADGWAGLDARFDFVRGQLDGAGNVPRIPPLRAGGGVYFAGESLYLRAGALHVFEQNEIAANETATKGYTDLQADLVWTATRPAAAAQVQFGLSGRNLLDADARNHVSFKKEDVLLPGRSVYGFVRLVY